MPVNDELRSKVSDIITNELFERFGSPSSAVIGVALTDRILALPEIAEALKLRSQRIDGLLDEIHDLHEEEERSIDERFPGLRPTSP